MSDSDTIAAISTPAGEGAIAIVRLSGPGAISVADIVFRGIQKASEFASHVQHLGKIVNRSGDLIDQVLLAVHRAPNSYTGEDLVEISCHGGSLISARVLEACLGAGARAAGPGEFTERAFLNGKMDLTQAEAVMDLIRARTDLALRSATEQLEGRLGQRIRSIRDELIALMAQVEASINFPEEGIDTALPEQLCRRFEFAGEQMSELLATADQGRMLREGVRVVIYGVTNAGKSSLLNRLVGHERVIVSESHGTTRDTIEEAINLRGIPIRLFDTAGLRDTIDHLELEGITRTEKSLLAADVRLHIADRSQPKPVGFDTRSNGGAEINILNKSDLPEHHSWEGVNGLRISCLTGEGIAQLEEQLLSQIGQSNLQPENSLGINARHRDCLRRALDACQRVQDGIRNSLSPECIAVDLKDALRALGEIIGEVDVEQVLDSVFSQFCIGK